MEPQLHIACLSEHASPLALLGGQDAGGQNVYVDEVCRQLGAIGCQIDIFTRRDRPDLPDVVALAPGVRVINLHAGPPEFIPKDDLWMFMADFLDALLSFMSRAGVRYDVIHSHFWMSGWVALQLQHRLGVPFVQTFHALGKTKQRHQGAADTSPAARIAVEHDIVRECDQLIAQCPNERAELIDDYAADPRKIALIPAAVNTERFRPEPRAEVRRRLGLDSDDFVVVYVGRMLPRKGVRNLMRGFARLAERAGAQPGALATAIGHSGPGQQHQARLKLLLVGGETSAPDPISTPEIDVLCQLAQKLGIAELVHYAGKRQPDELRDFYSAGDVMVTTPWYEPFGLTPLEAMACARPVIGSAVGGLAFTIQDQVTGLLVPPHDPEALAVQLYHLYRQPELRVRMGQAARWRVEREFTWARVALRLAALYRSLAPANTQLEPLGDSWPEPIELAIGERRSHLPDFLV
jgi:D-inositol-3-phosphate glycosyltransferase